MICRRCRTNNPESSVYCVSCGQPLIRKTRARKKSVPWYVIVVSFCVLLAGAYSGYKMILQSQRRGSSPNAEDTRGATKQTIPSDNKELPIIEGSIIVKDIEGKEISRWNSAVCRDNWIAFPVWPLLEGKTLFFLDTETNEIPIKDGFWEEGIPIVLWKLEPEKKWKTPGLTAWKQHLPLEWCSLLEQGSSLRVGVISPTRHGPFLIFPLPYEIQEPGVFVQEGHIVGWAFPNQVDRAYLWAGPVGAALFPNVQTVRFYDSVITEWRETHFHKILHMDDFVPAAIKLEAFAEGLRRNSPFAEEDIPDHLKSRTIVGHMHSFASEITKNGMAEDVARILDEDILLEALSLSLVKDAALARVESEDHNKALQFVERIKKAIFETTGKGLEGLHEFHAELYKGWLKKILDKGSYYSGMVAFEEAKRAFPDDLELHLLGVEIAIAEKNWMKARELLRMRDYPETLRDWAGELENNIQSVQENEGAVTIRFNPGASHIPVKVFLNESHSFSFIIDTGATLCSIPSIAVERLRIDIDQTTPVRLISTAGGIAETYEVKLDSVELGGFRVNDIEALIIDIPGYQDYGLLGQNFLNNFHIEIDNQKGILRLKKR